MGAVFKKEFRSSMKGVTGPLFMGVIICVISVFTLLNNIAGGYTNFEYSVITGSFWSLVFVPILTMSLFAEERHSKTDQLLYSLPLTGTQVVMGKFLAVAAVFAIPCAVFCTYPVIISLIYGDSIGFLTAYAGLITYFFMGCAVIAICMFISSLTDSQLISAIISIVLLILLFIVGSYTTSLSGVLGTVVSSVCIFRRIYDCASGYFDIPSLIYYISIAVLFIFFTVQSFEKRRWS